MKKVALAALCSVASLCACGGGASTPTPTPTPIASAPASGVPQTSLAAITFATSTAAVPLSITQPGYTGVFNESDTCNPISGAIAFVVASPSPAPGSAVYTVTPQGVGTCQITVTDDRGKSVVIPVTISAALFTVQ